LLKKNIHLFKTKKNSLKDTAPFNLQ